jgi:hypothetical protein
MRCRKFGISLNPSKYIFNVTQGKLLSHIVSDSGISIYPERVAAILDLPAPTSKKGIQAFMGTISFLHRFVPDFIVIVNVGRLVVVIDVNPSHWFWTSRLMKVFGHEGK